MAIAYREILRRAGLPANTIVGVTSAEIEAAYTTSPLTSTQLSSSDFPYSVVVDSLVATIGKIVRAYAFAPNHPFRTYNLSQTANIANNGVIPSVDSASNPIVGGYGTVRNAVSGVVMTNQPEQIIDTIVSNTDSFLRGTYDYFAITSDRLKHTAANAVIDVCTLNDTTIRASIAANGNAPIPDACYDIAVAGLISTLFIDDSYLSQAQANAQYFENQLNEIKNGAVAFMSAPTFVTSQAPAIS